MPRIRLLALACALAAIVAVAAARSPVPVADSPAAPADPFYLGGIQVHELNHARWTDTLRRVGMNTVAVTVYARQGRWDRGELSFAKQEPAVLEEIRAASDRGLAVVLVLRVALDHAVAQNKFLWHGQIMPESPRAIADWFSAYTRFVCKWAEIAQAEGVAVLGIGSELNAMTSTLPIERWGNLRNYFGYYWYQRMQRSRALEFSDEIDKRHLWVRGYDYYDDLEVYLDSRFEHTTAWARQAYLRSGGDTLRRINERRRLINDGWAGVIAAAREVYGGKLTYAANFDNYRNVGFWPQLDLIGINAYFPLRSNLSRPDDPGAGLQQMARRWEEILDEIEAFRRSEGLGRQPFLFTELGYTFRRHSTVEPWSHGGFSVVGWKGHRRQLVVWDEQPLDYEERHQALEALRRVHVERGSGLAGILYWKLSTDRAHEAIEPFVLHIGPDSSDPLQDTLARFVR